MPAVSWGQCGAGNRGFREGQGVEWWGRVAVHRRGRKSGRQSERQRQREREREETVPPWSTPTFDASGAGPPVTLYQGRAPPQAEAERELQGDLTKEELGTPRESGEDGDECGRGH